ncbi:hypothetical protein [Halopenitus persicus]|uniref:Uncharacterized protein n=1 Tax=Halopenitus persicus TaxID=1048396 RepID=A0A1H3IX05_9EURY|nr:hypothetical protein [Halopenitus persicus]SDY32221.1 hypothetical protein SAMN05216564_104294 [Halopenitus persicus]
MTGSKRERMTGFGSWSGTGLRAAVDEAAADFDEDFEDRQKAV